jgi:hypothetical protein
MSRIWLLLCLLAPTALAQREAEAAAAEARAFKATEEERWCDAVASFLEADSVAPVPDLLFNAARAAEVADDRALAAKLYAELLQRSPKAANAAEARKREAVLKAAMSKDGPGRSCADQATPPPTVVVVPNPTPTPTVVTPPPIVVADSGAGMRIGGIVALVGGGVLAVGGGVLAAFTGMPYLEHADVSQQIRNADEGGAAASSMTDLQERQRVARNSWDTFGRIGFPIGVSTAGVGVVLVVVGAVLVPLSLGSE